MTGQLSPPFQIQLETWQSSLGNERAMRERAEHILSNVLLSRYAEPYLNLVIDTWHRARKRPGVNAKIWSLFDNEGQVIVAALEVFAFLLSSTPRAPSGSSRRAILAAACGKRAEFALWMMHPKWRNSWHLEALDTLLLGDLSMPKVMHRLTAKGFGYAADYKPLTIGERTALGTMLIVCVCDATGLFVQRKWKVPLKSVYHMEVDPSDLYWEILDRWRDVMKEHAPVHAPMIQPPKDWSSQTNGGYLTLATDVISIEPHMWARQMGKAGPQVLGSINVLQRQALQLDRPMVELARQVWERGHEIGCMPKRERIPFPEKEGMGDSAFWKQVWRFNEDRRKDADRRRFIHSLQQVEKLDEVGAEDLHWVRHLDYRGRMYSRGHLSYQGPELYRSWLHWKERVPMARNMASVAYALGEYAGLSPRQKAREQWMNDNWQWLVAVGNNPLGHLSRWSGQKKPWQFVQVCHELAQLQQDPDHKTGLLVRVDQSSSGYGHLACMVRDQELALATNVIGHSQADLYSRTGELARERITQALAKGELNAELSQIAEWWLEHWPSRELLKKVTLPRIYGQRYLSAYQSVRDHLRVAVGDVRLGGTPAGPRLVGVAHFMAGHLFREAGRVTSSVRLAEKYCRDMGRWLIQQGHDPFWRTPSGMVVLQFFRTPLAETYHLPVGKKTIHVKVSDGSRGTRRMPRGWGGSTADLIHSFDASFAHTVVHGWGQNGWPIEANHDCFATTVDRLPKLRAYLLDSWRTFWQEDWMERIREEHAQLVGCPLSEVPAMQVVGTLDLGSIGRNPFLFH